MTRLLIVPAAVATLAVGGLLAWSTVRQDREYQRLIAAGDAALAQDQTYLAIEAFSGALTLRRDAMLAHLKRGDAYRRRGELAAALRDLRQASTLDPTATYPIELLGDVNSALGRYDRAIEEYARFLELDDRSPRVLYKLALTYYRDNQPSLAIGPVEQALALDEGFAEAEYLLGLCLRADDRPEEAILALTRAVALDPAFSAAREALVETLAAEGRPRDAIEQLEALAALDPANPARLVAVGLARAGMGQTDAAVLTLGRAAERFPDQPAVYAALGRVWLEAAERGGDPVALGKAIEALQPAAASAAATSDTLMRYGRALMLIGNLEAAERALRDATLQAPVEPAAFRHLAEAAGRLGHADAARDALARYRALTDGAPALPDPADPAVHLPGN